MVREIIDYGKGYNKTVLKKLRVIATISNFLILKPQFNIHSLKYQRSTTLGYKVMGYKNLSLWQKLNFFRFSRGGLKQGMENIQVQVGFLNI